MSYYRGQCFPMSFVEELTATDCIVDGRYGGLLIGPSHAEGGIICGCLYSGGFCVLSELEGYEYVINNKSNPFHKGELSFINDYKRDFETLFIPPTLMHGTPVIDTRTKAASKYHTKFLILSRKGGEGIVNKHSTKIYLDKLNEINSKVAWHPY